MPSLPQPSPSPLAAQFRLARVSCIRHESVRFGLKVTNTSSDELAEVVSLHPKNLAVTLVLESAQRRRTAHQLSAYLREGGHYHPPDRPATVKLSPGASLDLDGDLLGYFGGIEPGDYQVTAEYSGHTLIALSAPAALRVLPANPVAATTPRLGYRAGAAALPAAWVHSGETGYSLLLQIQSGALPGSPRHGFRLLDNFDGVNLDAAVLGYADLPSAHVVWHDRSGRLRFVSVDLETGQPAAATTVQTPYPGRALRSAASDGEGMLWIPYTDTARRRFAALHIGPGGAGDSYALNLGSLVPLGPLVNLWDLAEKLYFAWTAGDGCQLRCGRLDLEEPAEGFAALLAYTFDLPIVWLDGYMQVRDFERRDPMLWCVHRSEGAFTCVRFDVLAKQWNAEAALPATKAPKLTPIDSAVTMDQNLALLFSDPTGEVWYASTTLRKIVPLAEFTGRKVSKADHPGLLPSGTYGIRPWVYARYIDGARHCITLTKLEPASEPDLMEARTD